MPASPRPQAKPADRIASIVRMQALLFGSSSPGEYEELLDFPRDPRSGKIERIISILRAQGILLGSGDYLRGGKAARQAAEIPGLIEYLLSLSEAERAPSTKVQVLPRNLGKTFAARGWGWPLFGDYRPATPPSQGILLLYASPDRDGQALVELARLGQRDALRYEKAGACVDCAGPWLALAARPADLPQAGKSKDEGTDIESFAFSRYVLSLDLEPRPKPCRGRLVDPYSFEYPYLFFDRPSSPFDVARFVAELLSGILRVPFREAERIAESFSGRMPRS